MKNNIFFFMVLVVLLCVGCGISSVVDSFNVCYEDTDRGLKVCGELGLDKQKTQTENNPVLQFKKQDGSVENLYTFTEEELKTLYKETGIREKVFQSSKSEYSGIKQFCETDQFTGLSISQTAFLQKKNTSLYKYLKKISRK